MLFRLSNALASFESYINQILAKKLNIFVIIYLNNIYIYTKKIRKTYVNAICYILNTLRKYNLFANLKKF